MFRVRAEEIWAGTPFDVIRATENVVRLEDRHTMITITKRNFNLKTTEHGGVSLENKLLNQIVKTVNLLIGGL